MKVFITYPSRLFFLCSLFFTVGFVNSQSNTQKYIDSLEQLIRFEKSDTSRFMLLQKALYGTIDNFSIKVVENYIHRMKNELELHPWKKGEVLYHHANAIVFFYQSKYDQSLVENLLSLKLATKLGDEKAMARSYGNIALVHQVRADYITSIKYHFKGLELEKKLKNPGGVADSYNNLGIIYENLGQYTKALWYQQKSMATRLRLKDYHGVQKNLANIGNIY